MKESEKKLVVVMPPSMAPMMVQCSDTLLTVVRAMILERFRQDGFVESGVFPFNCSNPNIPHGGKMMVLAEEFGEVAKAAYECYTAPSETGGATAEQEEALYTELIQLAAVAAAWAEGLRRDA